MPANRLSPLVTIVTPCLNPEPARLAACIDSVAAQTYPYVEHIIIDGGSTDGSVSVLQARGVRFVSEPDDGQAHAINKGFRLGRGDLLGWLNADDELCPRATELAVAALADSPKAGWVYGDSDMRRDGQPYLRAQPRPTLDDDALERGGIVPQQGSLIARWALEQIGPLDEDLHFAMDYDLWLRLIDAGIGSVYVPEVLSIFNLHDGSKSVMVGTWEFGFERTISQLKLSRTRSAAATLGVAAALAARGRDSRTDPKRLEEEIERMVARLTARDWRVDRRNVNAAAYAEAAINELYASPRGYRYFFKAAPWLVPRSRRRFVTELVGGAARRVSKLTRRVGGHS